MRRAASIFDETVTPATACSALYKYSSICAAELVSIHRCQVLRTCRHGRMRTVPQHAALRVSVYVLILSRAHAYTAPQTPPSTLTTVYVECAPGQAVAYSSANNTTRNKGVPLACVLCWYVVITLVQWLCRTCWW